VSFMGYVFGTGQIPYQAIFIAEQVQMVSNACSPYAEAIWPHFRTAIGTGAATANQLLQAFVNHTIAQ
jgi:hypothetical protein